MATSEHSAIINRAARAALRPLGLQQKGRSRFWYDDQDWRAFFVELQPSSWSKGTYCNVGVMWLWHPWAVIREPHWVFNEFERITVDHSEFASYDNNPTGFETSVAGLMAGAVAEILRLRDQFNSVGAVAHHYKGDVAPGWPKYNRSVALGLMGSAKDASAGFRSVAAVVAASAYPNPTDESFRLNAERLSQLAHDSRAFKEAIEEQIAGCREGLRLRALTPPVIKSVSAER